MGKVMRLYSFSVYYGEKDLLTAASAIRIVLVIFVISDVLRTWIKIR